MKKLTKKQKAAYPNFLLYIDTNSKGLDATGKQIIWKVLDATNLLEAMRLAEDVIQNKGEYIYLVDIYYKTGDENEVGEPYYDVALRSRVHFEYGKVRYSQWHFVDSKHYEDDSSHKGLWCFTDGNCENGCFYWE